MTLADVLAAGLALTFVYALFSMLASVVKEAIAAKLQWRANTLKTALSDMLNAKAGSGATDLSKRVYGHALVSGISQNDAPSYLPARNFSLALIDTLTRGSQAPAVTAIDQAVASLPDGELKQRLNVYVNEAAGDLDELKSKLDSWFDDTMDRLSGIYKRHAQSILFLIGLILAVALNVDTLRIVSALQHSATRAQIAEMAEAYQKAHPQGGEPGPDDLEKLISALPLPIGWTICESHDTICKHETGHWVYRSVVLAEGTSWWSAVTELIGWLLTAVAISFGAPFWFDLMGQLINVRSAGPKPPRADASTATTAP